MLFYIDADLFRQMLRSGAAELTANKKTVNDLNVFPVPDGDTGTNMEFTMKGAVHGAECVEGNLGAVSKAMAKGALMGARGNSGVILSQFLKGVSIRFAELDKAGVKELAEAFVSGVEYAYKAVLKPTEGTILTVLREATAYAGLNIKNNPNVDIEEFFTLFLKEANESVKRTPDLLPVLKKAGVVDSGAVGLICVIRGFLKAVRGEEVDETVADDGLSFSGKAFGPDSVLEFGYCTEFILQLMNYKTDVKNFDLKTLTDYLETIGDSIVAIKDDDVVKVHVHTKTPAKAIEFSQQFGEFVTFKMENMSVQHSETSFAARPEEKSGEKVPFSIVAVATGEGLKQTFESMGADKIIDGGQTMNPSSEDFINAFNCLNAENIIVLPNNSNIFLAAKQAADLYEGAQVYVVNTSTIAEGYAALTMFDPEVGDAETIIADLERAAKNVCTISVTYAVRDGSMDGVTFSKGDYISVAGKTMLSSAKDKTDAAIRAMESMEDIEDREIATVIFGNDATEEDKKSVISRINEQFPQMETYSIDGGQAVYPFVIALE